jgi:hypothetical protein
MTSNNQPTRTVKKTEHFLKYNEEICTDNMHTKDTWKTDNQDEKSLVSWKGF